MNACILWSLHIESVCSRAMRLLGFMYRFFSSPHCDSDHSYAVQIPILPIVDYACVVWDPHLFNTLHLRLLIDPGMPTATMHFASSMVFLP